MALPHCGPERASSKVRLKRPRQPPVYLQLKSKTIEATERRSPTEPLETYIVRRQGSLGRRRGPQPLLLKQTVAKPCRDVAQQGQVGPTARTTHLTAAALEPIGAVLSVLEQPLHDLS